jgi:hypothetical protein
MANKPSSQPSDIRTVFQPHRNNIFLLEPILEVFDPFTIMALSPNTLKKEKENKIQINSWDVDVCKDIQIFVIHRDVTKKSDLNSHL